MSEPLARHEGERGGNPHACKLAACAPRQAATESGLTAKPAKENHTAARTTLTLKHPSRNLADP
ncbi:MAG: hypothetical protein ABIS50_03770 [Luteolibacter sp.]|uniref:hypothetical protein n=1 Tax=Luteolibacter sp. TaxID=1962973 RepID=UPI003265B027